MFEQYLRYHTQSIFGCLSSFHCAKPGCIHTHLLRCRVPFKSIMAGLMQVYEHGQRGMFWVAWLCHTLQHNQTSFWIFCCAKHYANDCKQFSLPLSGLQFAFLSGPCFKCKIIFQLSIPEAEPIYWHLPHLHCQENPVNLQKSTLWLPTLVKICFRCSGILYIIMTEMWHSHPPLLAN